MYTFPHPQAIFDGGGRLIGIFVNRIASSGITTIFFNYLVSHNRVLHVLHLYGRYDPTGTAGDIFLVIDMMDLSNVIQARLGILHGAFNSPPPSTTFTIPVNIIVPSQLKIMGYVVNNINANVYCEMGFYGVEYEVFRT